MSRTVGYALCRTSRRMAVAAALIFLAHGLVSAGSGTCISAFVSTPVVLPDGSEHQGGTITLCVERSFSPVSSFHEVRIDHHPVGLVRSRRGVGESPAESAPHMMFLHRPDGKLELYGYALPGHDRMNTYWLQRTPSNRPEVSTPATGLAWVRAEVKNWRS